MCDVSSRGPFSFVKRFIRKLVMKAIAPLVQSFNEYQNRLNEHQSTFDFLRERIIQFETYFNNMEAAGINLSRTFNMLDKRTNAQFGEDCIMAHIVGVLGIHFYECNYIDLGANRPKEMSNTYFFYSHGARGVLVEANPKLIPPLKFYRSEDIILNRCVDETSGKIRKFNILNADGLSTTGDVNELQQKNRYIELVESIEMKTISLQEIAQTYMPIAPVILSIDIESMDIIILHSNDWNNYRPLIVIVETIPYSAGLVIDQKEQNIVQFMESVGYYEYAFTGCNSIFIDRNKAEQLNAKKIACYT
jgi:hypothetical protein